MRAASSTMAGLGVGAGVYGGLRGAAPAAAPAEQAVRKSSVLASAILSSSSSASADVAPVQGPVRKLDGWGFAGGENDLVMAAGEPMPRVVFAGVPSFDKDKEATVELKEALDMEDATCDQLSGLSLVSNPDPETNSGRIVEALMVFSTSTAAQNFVASIVSDPNVLNAVMQNPVLQELLESNQKIAEFEEPVPKKSEDSSDSSKAKSSRNWFTGMFNNIKLKVVELVSSLSSRFQNIFGFSSHAKEDEEATHTIGLKTSSHAKNPKDSSDSSKAKPSGNWYTGMFNNIMVNMVELVSILSSKYQNIFGFSSHAKDTIGIGTSVLGLATMVVMVVLLKRV